MTSDPPNVPGHSRKDLNDQGLEDTRARPSTVGEGGRRLWLYPDRRPGLFANRRRWVAFGLMAFYLGAPYLSFGGIPLLRFDVLDGRASIFGMTFRNDDGAFAVFALLGLALSLFLFTAVRGRIWCGYACPQTVFIDWVIRPIEEWLEGNAAHRRAVDSKARETGSMPWSVRARKIVKQVIFMAIAAVVANTFLAYFVPPASLLHWMTTSPADHPVAFGIMAFVLAAFYFDLAWFREQFCAFLCPYARFQAVMIDKHTPTVSYDSKRGEPRGKGASKGDCIDCKLCVRVCPTGIDIRNGLQLECITCERCVDACDSIMVNLERPKGLIRVASQVELEGGKTRFWRARVVVYGAALTAVIAAFTIAFAQKAHVHLTMIRAPGAAFSQLPNGLISNIFTVRIANNRPRRAAMGLQLIAPVDAKLICGQCTQDLGAFAEERVNVIVIFEPKLMPADGEVRILHPSTGEEIHAPLLHP